MYCRYNIYVYVIHFLYIHIISMYNGTVAASLEFEKSRVVHVIFVSVSSRNSFEITMSTCEKNPDFRRASYRRLSKLFVACFLGRTCYYQGRPLPLVTLGCGA